MVKIGDKLYFRSSWGSCFTCGKIIGETQRSWILDAWVYNRVNKKTLHMNYKTFNNTTDWIQTYVTEDEVK